MHIRLERISIFESMCHRRRWRQLRTWRVGRPHKAGSVQLNSNLQLEQDHDRHHLQSSAQQRLAAARRCTVCADGRLVDTSARVAHRRRQLGCHQRAHARRREGAGTEIVGHLDIGSRKQVGEDGLSVTIRYAGLLTEWDNMPQPPPTWGRTRRELH